MKTIKNATIINVDCMTYMSTLPDKYFDLAVCDPPYGIDINISMGRRKGGVKSTYHKFAGEDKTIPNEDYFMELSRVSINQIIWGGNYMTDFLYPSACWVMWDKGFSQDVSFAQYEMAWTSFKSSAKKFEFNAAANKDRIHPTQKPVKLYEWLLTNYAKPGQKIFDSHMGSGSSAIACNNLGFEYVGCELDKDYFEAACKRIEQHAQQERLFA